jgi:putative membrane-bound dehydrogenase-like protein
MEAAAEPPKKPVEVRGPLTPAQALKEFHITPGLRIELVAAEPEIESPVAMAFDEDGRLWVVEMRDYPNGPAKGKPPEGRIKVLEDRDGDGRYETSRVFADELLFANGVLPWKGGVVVTAAPHIVYLRDTDGDGKADRREVLYEGFATQNPQLRVSHPVLGIDNWVYVANGLRGGQVKRAGKADAKPLNLGSMDFRFNLVHDRHEAISGMGQFGNCFDDWSRRFVCDNRHHLRHVVIESRYLQRNPYLAAPAPVEDISELEDGPLSSGGKIYPLSKNWTTSNLHAGRFTAACGVFVYGGDLLPEAYRGCAFTCDPTGNLVHQEILKPHGATFRSKPAREGVEFLATPDDWFRPVFLAHGPDGAMYVVDMYRAVIEHPEFMPTELKDRPDLTLGKDKGRIWRIVPEQHLHKPVLLEMSKAKTPHLVGNSLLHANAWHRTTAHRLILQRQDPEIVGDLHAIALPAEGLLIAGHPPERLALARLHAAWLLRAQGKLTGDVLDGFFRSDSAPLREHAVLLTEHRLGDSDTLQKWVTALASDRNDRVRYQAALSLGEWDDDRILGPLAQVALLGTTDRWTRLAVASAVPKRAGALIATLCQGGLTDQVRPDTLTLLQELATLVGARRDVEEVARLLETLGGLATKDRFRWQMAGMNGLAEGMGRRSTQLASFLKSLPASKTEVVTWADALLAQSARLAADPKGDPVERLAGVRLLAHASWDTAEPALLRLLKDDATQEIRLAAVRALAAHPRKEVPELLLKPWPGYTPAVRREVVEAMMRSPERIHLLLQEIEAGRIKPGDLDAARTRQLLKHGRADIRDRASKLLQGNLPAERKQVLEKYQAALKRKGDAKKGQMVFQKNCAACHRIAGVGVDVAPDISDTRTKTADLLLVDILNPNQAIDSNYINYTVVTKNGRTLTGIIAAETASSLTLRRAENQGDVVLRQDIDEIQSTGVSLMPEGLEKTITVEEMADLLTFLKNWRYLDGSVPLGDETPPKKE